MGGGPYGLLVSKGGHRMQHVCDDVNVCCAREGETGRDESAQALTRKT